MVNRQGTAEFHITVLYERTRDKKFPYRKQERARKMPTKMKLIQRAEKTLGTWQQLRKKGTDENGNSQNKVTGKENDLER